MGKFLGGETVLYFDYDHGYVCQKSQNFTLKRVDLTICKLCLKFFLRVRKDFPGNFCFRCNLKGKLGVTEIKVVGKKPSRQRKWPARAWQCPGMKDQCSGTKGSRVCGELQYGLWGEHPWWGRGVALAVLSVSQKQEGFSSFWILCAGKVTIWLVRTVVGCI